MKPFQLILPLFPLIYITAAALQQPLALHVPLDNTMATMNDKPSGSPLLADVIGIDRSLSIFSGFTRSLSSITERLSDRSENTTVLAPSNSAISKLPRKPWEDPNDGGAGGNVFSEIYKGLAGEDRATRNLRRFVEAHCVGTSPWGEGEKVKTLEGVELWWEADADGGKRVMPGGVRVSRVQGSVQNGELWVLEGVVNYDEQD
ncbi:hypothetical protein EDC01DRAFT_650026 [Geopyxis carbonaria]|nr:hypothetical protein EDC01DRAFT_650026 [Geopyxis carbonaria]